MSRITEDSYKHRAQIIHPSVSRKAFPREGGNHYRRSAGKGLASGSAFSTMNREEHYDFQLDEIQLTMDSGRVVINF